MHEAASKDEKKRVFSCTSILLPAVAIEMPFGCGQAEHLGRDSQPIFATPITARLPLDLEVQSRYRGL